MLGRRHTFTKSQEVSIDTDYKPFGDITIRTVPTKSQDVSMEMDYKSFRDTITQTSHSRTPYIGARMDIRLQLDCDIDHITQSLGK